MAPFEKRRDRLHEGTLVYERLGAVQLVKHAFGLRTQGRKRSLTPVLVYLYAEPPSWPDGRIIEDALHNQHRQEIKDFSQAAHGAEVRFASCSYQALLGAMLACGDQVVADHGARVHAEFRPC